MESQFSTHKRNSKNDDMEKLEITMQLLSRVVSLVGIGFMSFGFIRLIIVRGILNIPGNPTLPFPEFLELTHEPISFLAMSGGIILLALLPSVRVLIALFTYLRRKDIFDVLVAVIVFLELLFSIRSGI